MNKPLWLVAGLTVLFLSTLLMGCVVATSSTVIAPQIRSLYEGTYEVDPYMAGHMPRTIAVLPFLNSTKSNIRTSSDVSINRHDSRFIATSFSFPSSCLQTGSL
jgi:hypothetical protein